MSVSLPNLYFEHENELMCSEKTIYNNNNACMFDARNIDLPRKVKFRERYKRPKFKVDKGCRIGRSYKEFETFLEKNPDTAVVQMDFIIGNKSDKCLLTIHFVESSLMLVFLRDANTSQSVINVFNDRKGPALMILHIKIFLMMNHINSYKRKKLNNRSPYETFSFYHGEDALAKLGYQLVAPNDIMLKPELLK